MAAARALSTPTGRVRPPARRGPAALRPGAPPRQSAVAAATAAADGGPPLRIVVTGGSRGIGRALVEGFLDAGDDVVFCSRNGARVDGEDASVAAAQAELGARARPGQVARGLTANVAAPGDAARVVAAAQGWLPGGGFDVWISNAGLSHYGLVTQCDDAEVADLVATNLTGTLLCAKHALAALAAQPTGGHLFNMDGAGSDGGATPYFAAYGATKHALTQLHKSLKAELKAGGVTNVGVHRLSPGMVTTDLLMAGSGREQAKFFINCLAEAPADAAAFLVPRIRAVARSPPASGGDGATVAYLTPAKAFSQIAARAVFGARKGRPPMAVRGGLPCLATPATRRAATPPPLADPPVPALATLPEDLTLRVLAACDAHTRQSVAPLVCRAWRALTAAPTNAALLAADVWVDGVDRAAREDGVDARLRLDAEALLCWLAPRAAAVRHLTADDAHLPPHAWEAVLGALPALDGLDLLGDSARTLAWHVLPRGLRTLHVTGCEGSLGHDQLAALPPGLTSLRLEAAGAPDGGLLRSGSPFLAGFPAPVLALTGLRSLALASRGVAALPDGVAALTGLTRLAVMHAGLTRLPAGLGDLGQLEELDLRGNLLLRDARTAARALAPLARLGRRLVALDLSANGMRGDDTCLPGIVFGLTRLTTLRAAGNAHLDVPPDLGRLASLCLLDLRDCGLRDYPPGLGDLTGLRTLLLGRNARLAKRGLPSCASLTDLVAACAGGEASGPGGCNRMQRADESGSGPASWTGTPTTPRLASSPRRPPLAPLASSPANAGTPPTSPRPNAALLKRAPSASAAMAHLTKVTVLDLSRTGLRELPPGAEALTSLAELRLCNAASYPGTGFAWPSLARCPTLRRLDVSGSYFEELPTALTALPCLTELVACECGLARVGPAAAGLGRLARLVLDGNRLQQLPAEELALMPELEEVSLVDNLTMQLPPSLGALGSLRRLRRLDARKVSRGLCGGRPWTARSMWSLARAYEDLRAADPARDWAAVVLL